MDLIVYAIDETNSKFVKVAPIVGAYTFSCSTGLNDFSSNDFELRMPYVVGNKLFEENQCVSWGNTEFGGLIKNREIDTDKGQVTYRGFTWRGFWANNFTGSSDINITGTIDIHFEKFIDWEALKFIRSYVDIDYDNIPTESKSNVYEPAISLLKSFDVVSAVFDATFNIVISNGKLKFTFNPIVNHRFDASQTKIILEENWQRANIVYAVNTDYGRGASAYLQADGTVGAEKYYTGFNTVEKVIESSKTSESALFEQAKAELEKIREFTATEIFVELEKAEVGDMVTASIAEIGVKVQKKVVEKTLKINNGNEEITYTLEG